MEALRGEGEMLGSFSFLLAWTVKLVHDLYGRTGPSAGIPLVRP